MKVSAAGRSLGWLCFSIALLITLTIPGPPVYAGSSDLTVETIWLEKASAPDVPVQDTDLVVGESFVIVATIKNLGQENADGFYLDVYYDSDYGRGGPDNIAPGEAQEWYVGPLTVLEGAHTTSWVVDPDNQIAELEEQNNEQQYTFTIGSIPPETTTTSTTVTATVTEPAILYSYGTTTSTVTSYIGTETLTSTIVTSYVGTETLTSTIVVPTTVAVGPSTSTPTVQTTQVLTSAGTATVTGYTTTTITSYTGTQTLTSAIVVPTTVTIGASASTLTVASTRVLAATGTTTVIAYTTATLTSYTATTTSTSTSVVYTTVAKLGVAAAGASSPLIYIGFLSLLGVTVGRRVTGGKAYGIRHLTWHRGLLVSSPRSLSPCLVDRRDTILSRLKSLTEEACSCNSSSETLVHPAALVANLTEGAQSGESLSTGLNERIPGKSG